MIKKDNVTNTHGMPTSGQARCQVPHTPPAPPTLVGTHTHHTSLPYQSPTGTLR